MSHLNHHHSSNNNNNYNASSSSGMVVQYGFRDDDDDSEDGRPSLFGGLRQSSSRRLKKIGNVVSDAKSLLAGAKAASAGHFGLVYGLDNKYSDSDSESEESESDSDDNASVCSKASVASKAGKTLKKLGGKVKKGVKKVRGKRRGSDKVKEYEPEQAAPPPPMGHIHTNNSDHEDDEEDDLSDDDDGDASVASRASDAVRRVKGKLSKALKVVSRKNKKYNEFDDDDDSSLSSEEEDLLFDAVPAVPTSRRSLGLRRCNTSSSHEKRSAGPLDVHPTKQAPRRHTSDPMGLQVLRRKSKQPLQDDSDSLSDLSDHNDDARRRGGKKKSSISTKNNKNNTTASSSSFHNTNWSMNVTPEMKKKWEMNVSRNLLVVEADHGHGATRAA